MTSAALIVSILALALTVWQGWVTRTHNRLAVRPYVVSRNKKGRVSGGVSMSYEFINSGLGPAIIDELKITFAGERLPQSDPIEALLRRCIAEKFQYVLKSSSIPSPGYCLKPQEEYLLAEVFFPHLSPDGELALRQLLQPVDLVLRYSSFYGEKFVFPAKKTSNDSPDSARRWLPPQTTVDRK